MAEIFIPKWKNGNGSSFMKNLERYLRHHVDLEEYEASKRAIDANEANRALGNAKMDGLGQHVLTLPAREFFRWQADERGCWGDRGFVREFARDNSEFRGEGFTP